MSNKILFKTGDTSALISALLDASIVREPVFDAEAGFLWVKDKAGNKLRIAGPRATSSFWFKGIAQAALTEYPSKACEVGDVLFINEKSIIGTVVIEAGSLLVKVADTEDGIGSWYVIDKVSADTLKVSSDHISSDTLNEALDELATKLTTIDETNLEYTAENALKVKDNATFITVTASGDETGQKNNLSELIGSVSNARRVFLLFKKDISDQLSHISGTIFQQGAVVSTTKLCVNAVGAKDFTSTTSSPLDRVKLVTARYQGNVWYGVQFPPDGDSKLYFSGWKALQSPVATINGLLALSDPGYVDADLTEITEIVTVILDDSSSTSTGGGITIPASGTDGTTVATNTPTAKVNNYLGAVTPTKHILLLWPCDNTDVKKSRLVGQLYECGDDIDTLSNVLVTTRLQVAMTNVVTVAGNGGAQNRVVRVRMMVNGVIKKFIGLEFANRKAADIYLNGWYDVSPNLPLLPEAYADVDFIGDPAPVTGTTDSSIDTVATTQAAFRAALASVPNASSASDDSFIKYSYAGETNNGFRDDLVYVRTYLASSSKRVILDLSDLPITTITYPTGNYNNYAFEGLAGISGVILPKTLTSLTQRAFRNCVNLRYVDFTSSPGIKTVEYMTFYGCSTLESLKCGTGVTKLDTECVENCSVFKTLSLPGIAMPTLGYAAFRGTPSGVTVYVPQSLLSTYVGSNTWVNNGLMTSPSFKAIPT